MLIAKWSPSHRSYVIEMAIEAFVASKARLKAPSAFREFKTRKGLDPVDLGAQLDCMQFLAIDLFFFRSSNG